MAFTIEQRLVGLGLHDTKPVEGKTLTFTLDELEKFLAMIDKINRVDNGRVIIDLTEDTKFIELQRDGQPVVVLLTGTIEDLLASLKPRPN